MIGRLSLTLLIVAVGVAAAPAAGHAQAGNPVTSFTAQLLDGVGDPTNHAGTYPDRFRIVMGFDPAQANGKDLTVDLPAGFAGDANAVTACPRELLSVANPGVCPTTSQVGAAVFEVGAIQLPAAIYKVEGDRDNLIVLGFKIFGISGRMFINLLPDGRSRLSLSGLGQDNPLTGISVELWGIPADHQTAPTAPRRGFLGMPTRCDGTPLTVDLRINSWQQPGVWHGMSAEMGLPFAGCDSLTLDPELDFELERSATDSPTGVRMVLTVPQNDDPDGQVTARIKSFDIRFPEGMALSPGVANGLTACPEEMVGLGQSSVTGCPASSRIGTAELSSALLDDEIPGAVYLGRQQSETDYRMYIVVRGGAIDVKLAGVLHADPATGQISASIPDMPELPFERLALNFAGGPRAPLSTSLTCGLGSAAVTLDPHSGGLPVTRVADVAISTDPAGRPCPASLPFAPTFVAGTPVPRAGATAPLAVTIRRAPGEQILDRFTMTLPDGVSAKPGSVERCPAAAAALGACPPGSRVGRAIAEAGSGGSPFALEGDVFLTGPYRRAPFGMSIVFRGIAGPFDLGTIVVRSALRVDQRTGQVTIETDPLPRLVRGVQLRLQTIALDIDRPGFMINPTACAPSRASAVLRSAGGAVARPSSRFAVGGCRALRFRPSLRMTLTDPAELGAEGHPGVQLRYRASRRGANLRDLRFELPSSVQPSVTGPTAICSLTQLEDERCPDASRIGTVAARTPLLSQPMRGPVYTVQPPGNGVADVWAILRGMGVTVKLRMKNALAGGRLSGRLVDLPDIPLSSLTMTFASGDRGMFSMARDACVRGRARRMLAESRLTAHSAAIRRAKVRVRVGPGCRQVRDRD